MHIPQERGSISSFAELTIETLKDTTLLLNWFRRIAKKDKPVINYTEANMLNVVGAAERAIERGNNPMALFANIIANQHWHYINNVQEGRAMVRIAEWRDKCNHAPQVAAELKAERDRRLYEQRNGYYDSQDDYC